MELLYKSSVPNNISNWKVFEGDEKIVYFLTNQDNFKDLPIDDEFFQEKLPETYFHKKKGRTDQSNNKPRFHTIPKGVANLKNLFNLRERFKGSMNTKTRISCPIYETINLGTPENPKNTNLGKTVSKEDRKSYLKLFSEYQDVFAWFYREFKNLQHSHHSTHNPIKTWSKTLPTKAQEVPSIFGTPHVSRVKEITRC
jgi:hypothetical protein